MCGTNFAKGVFTTVTVMTLRQNDYQTGDTCYNQSHFLLVLILDKLVNNINPFHTIASSLPQTYTEKEVVFLLSI